MDNVQEASRLLKNAKQGYMVGSSARVKSVEERPVTKWIGRAIRTGIVAMILLPAYHLMRDDEPTAEHFHVPTKSVSEKNISEDIPANQQINQQINKRVTPESWSVISDIDASETTTPPKTQASIGLPENISQYKLPIDLSSKDTHANLVVKLYKKDLLFQASILQAEGLETKPYYVEGDSTQPTIGVGYNIKMSITAIGKAGVRRELSTAGISSETIDQLMSPDRAISEKASITPHQALALLDIASKRFEASTRAAVGADVYDKLPHHRQAALMMVDYNSNLHRRPGIVSAVRAGNILDVIENMETYGTVAGKRVRMANSALPQAMFYSKEGAYQVVMNPSRIKVNARAGRVIWQQDAEKQQAKEKYTRGIQESVATTQPIPSSSPPQSSPLSGASLRALIDKKRQPSHPPTQTPSPPQENTQTADTSWLTNSSSVKKVER